MKLGRSGGKFLGSQSDAVLSGHCPDLPFVKSGGEGGCCREFFIFFFCSCSALGTIFKAPA